MAVKDAAAKAAVTNYSIFHGSLLREAADEDANQHPMTARKLRFKAALVARAAEAEEYDPRPRSIGTPYYYDAHDR